MSRPIPTVLQHEENSSGAVCLAMILRSHGVYPPLPQLRQDCHADRDGISATDLAAAARRHGMDAEVVRCEPEDLATMPMPVIIHWRFQRYVLVEGRTAHGWQLVDPALGRRVCGPDEMHEAFTGVAIAVTGEPRRPPRGMDPAGPLVRLLTVVDDTRPVLVYFALVALLLVVPTLMVPRLIQLFADSLMGTAGLAAGAAALGLAVAAGITGLLQWLQATVGVGVATHISWHTDVRLVGRLLDLPLDFLERRTTSSLTQRTMLADQLSSGVSSVLLTGLTAGLTALAGTVALLVLDVWVGLAAVITGLLAVLATVQLLRREEDGSVRLIHETLRLGVAVGSTFSQIVAVRAGGHEEAMIGRVIDAQHRILRAEQRMELRSLFLRSLPVLFGGIGTTVIAAVAAARAMNGAVPPASYAAVLALAALTITPLVQAAAVAEQGRRLEAALDRIDDVVAECPPPATDDEPPGRSMTGTVALTDVCYRSSPWQPELLRNVSLQVPVGARVIVVADPGSGSSTIARLLAGLITPTAGQVTYDGIEVSHWDRPDLTRQVALVRSDAVSVEATWSDNIGLFDPDVSEQAIRTAATEVGFDPWLARHPAGLHTPIRPFAENISTGEWQVTAILRALARSPRVLILDHAMTALDAATACAVDQAVRSRRITCLELGPPGPWTRDTDSVVLLDAGRVAAMGSHGELLATDDRYRLWMTGP